MTGGRRQVANALLLLSLVLGVLGMHALVLLPAAPGVGGHVAAPAAPPIAATSDPSAGSAHPMGGPEHGAMPDGSSAAAVGQPSDRSGHATGHGSTPPSLHHVLHLCLAILTALFLLVAIAPATWSTVRPDRHATPLSGLVRRAPRCRPPPTSVRLAQLCVLRN